MRNNWGPLVAFVAIMSVIVGFGLLAGHCSAQEHERDRWHDTIQECLKKHTPEQCSKLPQPTTRPSP